MDAMDDDWDIDTLMNCTTIPAVVQIHLRKVYLSLFCILVAAAFGAYCYQLWNIGGLVTRLAFIVALACFALTKTWTRWKRVAVLLVAAFCGGALVGPLINLIVMTDTGVIVSTIGAIAVAYGCFSVVVMLTLRRCYIYLGSLIFSSVLIRIWLHFASIVFGGYTAYWEIKLYLLAIIYIVGVVVYSQVMIEQADQFRDIDYVDHVLDITVYFAGILIVIVLMLLRKASKFGKGKKKKKLN